MNQRDQAGAIIRRVLTLPEDPCAPLQIDGLGKVIHEVRWGTSDGSITPEAWPHYVRIHQSLVELAANFRALRGAEAGETEARHAQLPLVEPSRTS